MRTNRLPGSFHRLLGTMTISNLGDGVAAVAYPWLASSLTRDPFLIGLMGVAGQSAWLLFAIPAGGVVDRVDRKKLLIRVTGFQFVVTLAVAAVVYAGRRDLAGPGAAETVPNAGLWLGMLFIAVLGLNIAEVLRDTGTQSIVPAIVGPHQLERANGRLLSAEVVANHLLGQPLGGLLIAIALWVPFGFDAASFALGALLITTVAGRFKPSIERTEPQSTFRVQLGEGVCWFWRHPILRPMTLTLAANNFVQAMAFATFVLYAQEVLGLDAVGFGLLSTGSALAGVIAGTVATGVIRRLGSGGTIQLCLIGSIISLIVIGLTSSGVVVWAAGIVPAFLGMVWSVLSRSLRQRLTPSELIGRATGVHRTLNFGVLPLGAAVGGALVALLSGPIGREDALRVPWFIAAAGLALLVPYARARLNTSRIEAATQEDHPTQG